MATHCTVPSDTGHAHLPIFWKDARIVLSPGPGNADFWLEGLARIGDSNGDCTDEKRLQRKLVLACTLDGTRAATGPLRESRKASVLTCLGVTRPLGGTLLEENFDGRTVVWKA